METSRPIIVKRVPENLNLKQARAFQEEVRLLLEHDRPQLVFDLSLVCKIDAAGVDMLLHCMAEAVRHDGDLKLASLSPQAQVVLDLTRAGRLFEIFASSTDAVRSFSEYLPSMVLQFRPEPKLEEKLRERPRTGSGSSLAAVPDAYGT